MPRFKTGGDESKRRLIIRLFTIGAFLAIGYGVLISRAIFFHLKDNTEISRVAMRQYRTAIMRSTERGKILDSNGRELAINLPQESVYADPRFVKEPSKVAEQLAAILDMDASKLMNLLTTNRKFVWLKRRLAPAEAKDIAAAKLKGIYLMTENGRSYPNGELASAVIGTVSVDAEGLSGVEYQYDEVLLSHAERNNYRRDARGHLYLSPAKAGEASQVAHVELTIDKTLQYLAERELKDMVARAHAKNGVLIVLDANNGDVLAMANMPPFNPNHFENYSPQAWRNRAVTDVYEPGSTFKAIPIATALDRGVVTEEDIFDCGNGKLRVGKMVVNDAHPHKKLSVADVVKVSSNIGAARIEAKMGKDETYKGILDFGFGEPTGIDLPGESKGLLSAPRSWSDLQFVTIAFGQGVGATPLQMTLAFAAIANGGELLHPHVVKRVLSEDEEVLYERKKEVRRRSLKLETAALMKRLLQRVVTEGGTGILAASEEYAVAGKTGTAQKASPRGGYMKDKYYSSFIGFAPVKEPRVVVYVGIDEPQGYYYGGQVAAPVFREVIEGTLHYLNVPAHKEVIQAQKNLDPSLLMDGPAFDGPPQAIRDDLLVKEEAAHVAMAASSETETIPRSAASIRVIKTTDGRWKIPDFQGLTMKEVLRAWGDAPLDYKFVGSGLAVRQKPAAGSVVDAGAVCTVEFKNLL